MTSTMMKRVRNTDHTNQRPYLAKRLRVCGEHSKGSASFESLPAELFCHVLSFIGPTSSSLISLTQVNLYFRDTMKVVGTAMLPHARAHFRVPLPAKGLVESSTSLFVRHARACTKILDELSQLRDLLNRSHVAITEHDVKKALELALNLLEVGPSFSHSLEKQILSSCGKLGGKAFKYSKWVLWKNMVEAVDDDVSPSTLRRRNEELAKNEERLDIARLIMQIVVCRDWQLSKQFPAKVLNTQKESQYDLKVLRYKWY